MNFPFSTIVTNEEETESVAKLFSAILQGGDVVALNGNLGAGKTFFTKSLCKNYGIENSSSPSFAIVNEYKGTKKIYHFDFYRIKRIEELYDIGFEEYVNDLSAITFIEWADMMRDILPSERYEVKITIFDENRREIKIDKFE